MTTLCPSPDLTVNLTAAETWMDRDETLALKLASLVAPNWPTIRGTDISVLDILECARRGTLEQQELGKQAREVIGQIMDLGEDAPLRRLLEGLCRTAERSSSPVTSGGRITGSGVTAVGRTRSRARPRPSCRFPAELIHRTLGFVIVASDDGPSIVDLVLFSCLRSVNRTIQELTEKLFPDVLHRYVNRVVRKLVHVLWDGNPMTFTRLALNSSPLLSKARSLQVWLAGADDEPVALNSVLCMMPCLEKLAVMITSDHVELDGIDLRPCRRLKTLRLEGADRPTKDLPPILEDIYEESADVEPWRLAIKGSLRGPKSLTEVEVGSFCDISSQWLIGSVQYLSSLRTLILDRYLGPHGRVSSFELKWWVSVRSLDFGGCGVGDDLVAVLRLGRAETKVRRLVLTKGCLTDPDLLALNVNSRLVHLNLKKNSLRSAAFGLDLNKHLRHLDLTSAFDLEHVEGGVATVLRELGAQLAENTTLEVLLLGSNEITDTAVRELRLDSNTGLRKLSLESNKLSDEGLRSSLNGNGSLLVVDARNNQVTQACAEELSHGQRRIVVQTDDESWGEDEVLRWCETSFWW